MAKITDARNDIFLGCSSDFLALPWKPGDVLQECFADFRIDRQPVSLLLWTAWGEAHVGQNILHSLDLAARTAEWAILVFRADDRVRRADRRGEEQATVRDNVVFELGLLIGNLGRDRVFVLEEEASGTNLHVPSDIDGLIRHRFHDEASFRDRLKSLQNRIADLAGEPFMRWVPSASLAIGYLEQAIKPFVRRRQDSGHTAKPRPFKLRVLVPADSLEELEADQVRSMFMDLGFEQVGPEGPASGRPAMWQVKGGKPGAVDHYFDIPTTLHTTRLVIEQYLPGSTAVERQRLIASQTRSFARGIRSGKHVEVLLRSRKSIDKILRDAVEAAR